MVKNQKLEIVNFRGIQLLTWCPTPGINCLIGPGDSSKSTVLDAIDLCVLNLVAEERADTSTALVKTAKDGCNPGRTGVDDIRRAAYPSRRTVGSAGVGRLRSARGRARTFGARS